MNANQRIKHTLLWIGLLALLLVPLTGSVQAQHTTERYDSPMIDRLESGIKASLADITLSQTVPPEDPDDIDIPGDIDIPDDLSGVECESSSPTLLGDETEFVVEVEEETPFQIIAYDFGDTSPVTVAERIEDTYRYTMTHVYTQTGMYTATISLYNDIIYSDLTAECTIGVMVVDSETAASLKVKAEEDELIADGESSTEITAMVVNADDEAVDMAGVTVEFSTTLGTLTITRTQTNEDGKATVTLTSGTEPGTAVVTAEADGLAPGSVEVEFFEEDELPIDGGGLVVEAQNETMPANGHSKMPIRAWFVNEDGEKLRVNGESITFETSLGSFKQTGPTTPTMSSATAETKGSGEAMVRLVSDVFSGTAVVTATAEGFDPATTEVEFILRGNSAQAHQRIDDDEGGELECADGNTTIVVPADALEDDSDIVCTSGDTPNSDEVFEPGIYEENLEGLGYFLGLYARGIDGRLFEKFDLVITIRIDLEFVTTDAISSTNMRLYYWDGDSWVDPTTDTWCDLETCGWELSDDGETLLVNSDHFSNFALVRLEQAGSGNVYLPLVGSNI